jgi:lipopolysaccharide transport system permease protein
MIGSLVQYRSFIWRHARADLRNRYAGTGMGVVWNVIHPLATITVYSIVFGIIIPHPPADFPGRLPYVFFLCSAFFPWIAFTDCLSRGCLSFILNATYLKKLPIPEQVFVAQNAASSTLSLVLNFAILISLAFLLGLPPGWIWFLLPLPLIMMQTLGFGLGLLLGTLNVFFRDISEWVGIVLQLTFWSVPIVYVLPDKEWVRRIMLFHPLMPAIHIIRQVFLYRRLAGGEYWIGLFAWPLVITTVAFLVLKKLRPEIRDVI